MNSSLLSLFAAISILSVSRVYGTPLIDDKNTSEECEDNPKGSPKTNCTLIVQADYCGNRYYGKYCCKSCKHANEMKIDITTQTYVGDKTPKVTTERMYNDPPQPETNEKPKVGQALGLESAEMACKTFGKEWKITRRTSGSAVCSTVPSLQNCHDCESWRLLVWEDGACDRLVSSKCRFDTTKSGNYYCGYDPCNGGDLVQGGLWGQFGAHPNN